jgi:23S rRNA pseudouridine1911/1915/1917 synthase
LRFARQALHAERLALVHPQTRRNVSWQSAPPADMQELLSQLRDERPKDQSPITSRR